MHPQRPRTVFELYHRVSKVYWFNSLAAFGVHSTSSLFSAINTLSQVDAKSTPEKNTNSLPPKSWRLAPASSTACSRKEPPRAQPWTAKKGALFQTASDVVHGLVRPWRRQRRQTGRAVGDCARPLGGTVGPAWMRSVGFVERDTEIDSRID